MPDRWTGYFYCEFSNNIIFDEKCGAVTFKIYLEERVSLNNLVTQVKRFPDC